MSARDYTSRHSAPVSRRPVGPAIIAAVALAVVVAGVAAGLLAAAAWGPAPAVWVTP